MSASVDGTSLFSSSDACGGSATAKSCSTVTQAAIVVDVMEARDAGGGIGSAFISSAMPSGARHLQRDGNSTIVQCVALFLVQAQQQSS